ncbi:MAG: hxuB 1 [Firmicutes bacterium]|nr:hxuB 1 [Bacillota bacterium]
MSIHKRYLAIAILTAMTIVHAPVKATVAPDAGQTEKSTQERQLVLPPQTTPDLAISQQQVEPQKTEQGPKIRVDHIRFTGQNIFSKETLLSQIQDGLGKELSLNDLEFLAWRITRYLRSQGYLVAAAYIPAQEVKNNTVEISILIGQYGKISVRNHSTLNTGYGNALLSALHSGDYIKNDALERTILLLDDISGVKAKATLAPGETTGTTNLIVDLSDTKQFEGTLTADNYGNWYTGKNRMGIDTNINNITGIGDQMTVGGIYAGSGLDNQKIAYQVPVGNQGAKLGAGYERTHYLLGGAFATLGARGTAITTSLFTTYPLIRSRNLNLYGRVSLEGKKLNDHQDAVDVTSDKRSHLVSIGFSGDRRDTDGSGITAFDFTCDTGKLNIHTPDVLATDQMSANTNGRFAKGTLSLIRLKQINPRLSYVLSFIGQLASKNLDSSEKLYLGGATGVRAYPQGEASGDEGYTLTSELRWNMPTPKFQLATFIDTGRIKINKHPWENSDNHRTLSGAGLGVIWNWDHDTTLRMDYAWKLTSDPAQSDADRNGRFWLQCIQKI